LEGVKLKSGLKKAQFERFFIFLNLKNKKWVWTVLAARSWTIASFFNFYAALLLWLSWPGKCAHINQNIGKQSMTTDRFMLLHRPLGGWSVT